MERESLHTYTQFFFNVKRDFVFAFIFMSFNDSTSSESGTSMIRLLNNFCDI